MAERRVGNESDAQFAQQRQQFQSEYSVCRAVTGLTGLVPTVVSILGMTVTPNAVVFCDLAS